MKVLLTPLFIVVALLAHYSQGASGPGDVVGKLVVGYQGWFAATGDNSPMNHWVHWVGGDNPSPGHQTFELWPDTREYENLYDTGYAGLGNGQPSRLFSSYDDQTVDTHFKWMQQNNIDTAALQRFAGGVKNDDAYRRHLNGIADKVRRYAEVYGRKFYMMWDISGWDNYATELIDDLERNIIGELQLTDSSAYAHQNGRPVICVWGFGFDDRPGDAGQTINVINDLKNRGFYVIGGVPTHWRTGDDGKAGFLDAYLSLDMIQPWSVGRFGSVDEAANYGNWLRDDFDFLNERNLDFQPVVFAGFAWSNWQPNSARNQIPRQHGDFMWRQFLNLRQIGIPNVYVAMFDEYDEGTAIAKAAEDGSMAPTNQYFLTLDADGVHVSSDFYLRLAGDGNRLVKGEIPPTDEHPTPHTI